jgi:hypothetical protein
MQLARAAGLLIGESDWYVRFYAYDWGKPLKVSENWQQLVADEPVVQEVVPVIDIQCDAEGPSEGVPADCFAIIATKEIHLAGDYEIWTRADDGVRVFLDGKKIIDNWSDHNTRMDVAKVSLSNEKHTLRVEYYEASGEALLQVGIRPVGSAFLNPN